MKIGKNALRKQLLARRNTLPESQKSIANQLITNYILDFFSSREPAITGAYLAFGGEPDITPAMQRLHQQGYQLAVPKIARAAGIMQFHPWHPQAGLQRNRYGIAEPDGSAQTALTVDMFDCMLIPLVGFDAAGQRLGMGGGYYDRWLATADSQVPERIGIAYHWQQQARIPSDTMDQPLHRVITDHGVIDF